MQNFKAQTFVAYTETFITFVTSLKYLLIYKCLRQTFLLTLSTIILLYYNFLSIKVLATC